MRHQLYEEVILLVDVPEKGLQEGDVATIVDHHPVSNGEDGYSLEVFNALGDTVAVIALPESAVGSLSADKILTARSLVNVST